MGLILTGFKCVSGRVLLLLFMVVLVFVPLPIVARRWKGRFCVDVGGVGVEMDVTEMMVVGGTARMDTESRSPILVVVVVVAVAAVVVPCPLPPPCPLLPP